MAFFLWYKMVHISDVEMLLKYDPESRILSYFS